MGKGGLRLVALALALLAPTVSAGRLQDLIDATPEGGTLKLAPGSHAGPASITRRMTVDGEGKARIVGNGRGTVLSVAGTGVTLRGLHVAGSGESHDAVDAGILLEGEGHRVEDNVIEDVLFGIHLKRVDRSRVANNRVTGKPLDLGMRGDAIRLWYSRDNVVENNRFERARDLTFANSPDNRVANNRFRDGRYGMHVIFSPRLVVENNRLSHTGTGIIVLYSPDLVLRGNHVAHALTGGGAGIVFKESHDALVEDNEVLHCSVGLRVDAPPEAVGKLTVRRNRFAHNIIGLFFYGEEGGHRFSDNRFESNLTTVGISAPGAGTTPKFHCSVPGNVDEDGQLIRYKVKPHFKGQAPDRRNGEIQGEFLSSRFSKALGFFADDEWVADVNCPDCEKSLTRKFQGAPWNPFQPAAGIELSLARGIDVNCNNKDAGSLSGALQKLLANGAPRAEIDAFKLWLAFIDHGDTKTDNHKFACLRSTRNGNQRVCEPGQAVFYVSDMGSTFGYSSASEKKATLKGWSGKDPIKVSGGQCSTTAKSVGDQKISEAGRRLLADGLQRLLNAERSRGTITKVFRASRNAERDQPAEAWTAEFIRKANTIINARCSN